MNCDQGDKAWVIYERGEIFSLVRSIASQSFTESHKDVKAIAILTETVIDNLKYER